MATRPFTSDARVVLFTEHACLTAGLAVGGRRVLDLLNDQALSVLALDEPVLIHPRRLDEVLGTFGSGRLRKSDLICLAVLEEPERLTNRRLAAFVPKTPVHVRLLLRSMVAIGTLHAAGRGDPLDQVMSWPEPFLALTDAGVLPYGSAWPTETPPEPTTLFINRQQIIGAVIPAPVEAEPSRNGRG